jgi:hypothetical protein
VLFCCVQPHSPLQHNQPPQSSMHRTPLRLSCHAHRSNDIIPRTPPIRYAGWQVCGTTYDIEAGCIHVDQYGRLFPSWERYPSTSINNDHTRGTWKPFVDRVHARGIAFGLHLMHGIPKLAVNLSLPILNSTYTADEIVATPLCPTFIPDHWTINASHPGAQLYYDSVVSMWAADGIDFV